MARIRVLSWIICKSARRALDGCSAGEAFSVVTCPQAQVKPLFVFVHYRTNTPRIVIDIRALAGDVAFFTY